MRGNGLGKYTKGAPVTDFEQTALGDLLACYDRRRDAMNLIRVTAREADGPRRGLIEWRFADGERGGEFLYGEGSGVSDVTYSLWQWQYDGGAVADYELYRAVAPGGGGRPEGGQREG